MSYQIDLPLTQQQNIDSQVKSKPDLTSCLSYLNAVNLMALLVIGSMAAAGHFFNPTFGWVVTGLGAWVFLLTLCEGTLKHRKWDIIPALTCAALISATFVTVGILGGLNMFTTAQVGWGVAGTIISVSGLMLGFSCYQKVQVGYKRNLA